jgi:hypothetical protein
MIGAVSKGAFSPLFLYIRFRHHPRTIEHYFPAHSTVAIIIIIITDMEAFDLVTAPIVKRTIDQKERRFLSAHSSSSNGIFKMRKALNTPQETSPPGRKIVI